MVPVFLVVTILSKFQVPRSTFTLCAALKQSLDCVNTVRDNSDFGIDVYDEVVCEVGLHLTHGCRGCSLNFFIVLICIHINGSIVALFFIDFIVEL